MRDVSSKEHLAHQIAFLAHEGQKYSNGPYIEHPKRVAFRLTDLGITNPDYFAVAWLHDVIEDTTYTTLEDIEKIFGKDVREAVDAISRRRGTKYSNGKESERSYLMRVRANEIARVVKLADMNDNLMMTASVDCSSDKKKLWRKYINAIAFLSDVDRPYQVELFPLYSDEELTERRKDSYFDEEYS